MKPHIHLSESSDYSRVLVCGSPDRALLFSSFLANAKPVAKNREYHSYLGQFEGKPILVTSHGVGSAGAAICFQELIDVGAKSIIRIGTAGGLYEKTKIGDIVVATAAVRDDGVSGKMIPVGYPAVASLEIAASLMTDLASAQVEYRDGIVLTSDLFYPSHLGNSDLELYSKAGVVAVEMECSTLFVCGSLRQVRTGALLVLDGSPLKWSEGHYDPNPNRLKASFETCVRAALTTLTGID
jgi:uridine phosphorylase